MNKTEESIVFIGFAILAACLVGNTIGFIFRLVIADWEGVMWHVERFTYFIPILGAYMWGSKKH